MRPLNLLYIKNGFMNWTNPFNADSDVVVFGWTDILLFDFQMLGVHCSYTCLSKNAKILFGNLLNSHPSFQLLQKHLIYTKYQVFYWKKSSFLCQRFITNLLQKKYPVISLSNKFADEYLWCLPNSFWIPLTSVHWTFSYWTTYVPEEII